MSGFESEDWSPKGLRSPRILQVACKHFFSAGYAAATFDAIARDAHVAKRTLYLDYGDKKGLFIAVVRDIVGQLGELEVADFAEAHTLESLLEGVAANVVQMSCSPASLNLNRMVIAEVERLPELSTIVAEHGEARVLAYVRRALEFAVERGMIEIGSPALTAELFLDVVVGATLWRRAMGMPARPDESEHLKQKVRALIALASPPARS